MHQLATIIVIAIVIDEDRACKASECSLVSVEILRHNSAVRPDADKGGHGH